MSELEFNLFESELVPKHEILSEEEKAKLLEDLNITLKQLPKIREDDAVVKVLGAQRENIIKITRSSPTGGTYYYYRVVVGEPKKEKMSTA